MWEFAAEGRLEKFGEWSLIDSVCKNYNYKHDEVFKLSWREVMTMIYYNRELKYIEDRVSDMQKKKNKS